MKILPLLDSDEMAQSRQRELEINRQVAVQLGLSSVEAADVGYYFDQMGQKVDWSHAVQTACEGKISISPDSTLPIQERDPFPETTIRLTNETTLGASQQLVQRGLRPLALNFANGVQPGGGFLVGARAQEEALCRSSALYKTLVDDPMYEAHRERDEPDSTDWIIYSPDVPVFRDDEGTALDQLWLLSFVTCAAPYAPTIGQPKSGDLLQHRIHRVLSVAQAYDYETLVLGAWGCGAFRNDPHRTAVDFRRALEQDFAGVFSQVMFAITDWSTERRFLKPFHDVFADEVG